MSDPALPSSLSFQGKAPSVRARSYRAMSQPSNGHSFKCSTGGTLIRIPVPCGKSGTYIDPHSSYLSFNIANDGADATLNNGAWCVIQELKIVSQGITLTHINQYNVLHSALMHIQCGSDIATSHNLLSGTLSANAGVVVADGANKTFCWSLIDGILGSLAEKMCPVTAMSDLEIQLTLAPDSVAVEASAATEITITEVKWFSSMLEIDAAAQKVLEMSLPGQLYRLDSKGYHNYNDTIQAGVSNASVQVAAKFQSLNAVLFMMRDNARSTGQDSDSVSHREKRGLTSFQIEIAGQLYPPQPITCAATNISNAASELYKCFRALGVSNQLSSLTATTFIEDAASARGHFVGGCSFENYGSTSGQLMDGINSLGSNVQVNLSGTFPATVTRIDVFGMHDQVLTIEPQTGIAQMIF